MSKSIDQHSRNYNTIGVFFVNRNLFMFVHVGGMSIISSILIFRGGIFSVQHMKLGV